MEKKIFILLTIVVITIFATCMVACDDSFQGDTIKNGVFLLPGAEKTTEEVPSDWVAVIGDKMTVSEEGKISVYELKKGKVCYNADSKNGTWSVTLSGNKLILDDKGEKTEYVQDEDYKYSDIKQESLIPILEPTTFSEDGNDYVSLCGKYSDQAINGMSVEIKTADSNDYKIYGTVMSEDGVLSVAIPLKEFSLGDNYIKLGNAQDYPLIDGGKNLFIKTGSGSIEYKVTLDENGNITYLQNNTALENGVYEFAYSDELMSSEGKSYWNFVVIDGLLKESYKGGRILYYLSDADGVYSMKIFNPENIANSTFTVKNGIITVTARNSGKVFQFKKDEGYTYQEKSKKLEKPVNPTYAVENYDSGQQIWFRFFALDTYYPVGVRTEIKRAGSEDYEFYDIDVPYRAEICVDGIGADKFDMGFNFIRICNVGAPVSTNDKNYYMAEDSEYVEFIVLLDETGIHIGRPYIEDNQIVRGNII